MGLVRGLVGGVGNDYVLNVEVEVGRYLGKTLYRKVIELSEISVGTMKIATTMIGNSIDIKHIGGDFVTVYAEKISIPFFESTASFLSAYLTDYGSSIAIVIKCHRHTEVHGHMDI